MASRPLAYYVYRTAHGAITICVNERGVQNVVLGAATFDAPCRPTELSNQAATELQEYLAGKRFAFDVPTAPCGSDFQRAVWDEIARIPYGMTRTATDIAQALGRPHSHRAVGAAARENPLAIIVADQRLVKSDGHSFLEGAPGRVREALLRMEKNRSGAGHAGLTGAGF